jgi:hypothetical protein
MDPAGKVSTSDGSSVYIFIEPDKGVIAPLGTRNTFKRYLSPAILIDTVNTLGKPYYAWRTSRPDKKGVDIH